MKRERLKLAFYLFLMGFAGVLTILTMDIQMPEELAAILLEQFTPLQIKLLSLINPSVLLLVAIALGVLLHESAGLNVPVIKKFSGFDEAYSLNTIVKYGIVGGFLSGLTITSIAFIFEHFLKSEFAELGEKVQPGVLARFLYGGITEELLLRFGLMTLFVWVLVKAFKNQNAVVYWIGIVLSALLFGLGHFPVVFQTMADPSILLLLYVLVGNSVGGIIFGWLYWKKGLESAMIAHAVTHVVFLLVELFK